jgi:hypothetical protein
MPGTLTIRDETTAGDIHDEWPLEFPSERVTVRDLIRERVYQEVQDFNLQTGERVFRGLVPPTDAERILNGRRTEYRLNGRGPIDWKPQFEKALEAFQRGGFFILIDDRQAEDVDQEFMICHGTVASFLRLTPLVGG